MPGIRCRIVPVAESSLHRSKTLCGVRASVDFQQIVVKFPPVRLHQQGRLQYLSGLLDLPVFEVVTGLLERVMLRRWPSLLFFYQARGSADTFVQQTGPAGRDCFYLRNTLLEMGQEKAVVFDVEPGSGGRQHAFAQWSTLGLENNEKVSQGTIDRLIILSLDMQVDTLHMAAQVMAGTGYGMLEVLQRTIAPAIYLKLQPGVV